MPSQPIIVHNGKECMLLRTQSYLRNALTTDLYKRKSHKKVSAAQLLPRCIAA